MTPDAADRAAQTLASAARDREPIEGLAGNCRPRSIAEAYRIQNRLVDLVDTDPIGWKVGATSEVAQRHLRVPTPFSGRLLSTNARMSGAEFSLDAFTSFCLIEPEFAFVMSRSLEPRAAAFGRNEVASSIGAAHPSIEIVDSRYKNWLTVGTPSLVADNGVHGAFVRGAGSENWQSLDLRSQQVALYRNGQVTARGFGMAALGDPLNVVVWLANHLSQRGIPLIEGQIVSTGIVTDIYFAKAGDDIIADFGTLGQVEVSFTE